MSEDAKDLVEIRSVSMYAMQWDAAFAVSEEHDYSSISAGLRRIVNEWLGMKGAGVSVEHSPAASGEGA